MAFWSVVLIGITAFCAMWLKCGYGSCFKPDPWRMRRTSAQATALCGLAQEWGAKSKHSLCARASNYPNYDRSTERYLPVGTDLFFDSRADSVRSVDSRVASSGEIMGSSGCIWPPGHM